VFEAFIVTTFFQVKIRVLGLTHLDDEKPGPIFIIWFNWVSILLPLLNITSVVETLKAELLGCERLPF